MRTVVIGEVRFEPDSGEVHRQDEIVRLRPNAAAALELLCERPGDLVSRQEFYDRIWPRGGVELDLGLNVCIRQIRKALGDDAERPRYVETLRGRGYRLIAPVEIPDAAERRGGAIRPRPRRGWGAALTVAALGAGVALYGRADPPRIAVVPFEVESLADSLHPVGRGLADEVITTLASHTGDQLAVLARTSSFSGRDLDTGATHLVSGRIRPSGRRFVVTAELVDADEGRYAWSRRFDVSGAELLGLHHEIARGVMAALSLDPITLPAVRPLHPDARLALFRARFLLDRFERSSAERARVALDDALARDSSAVPVLLEMARAHLQLGEIDEAEAHLARARQWASDAPDVEALSGRVALYGRRDPERALSYLARAVARDPGVAESRHTYAQALASVGRLAEAAAQGEVALELDPVSSAVRGDVGWIFYYAGRFARALDVCGGTIELLPDQVSAHACMVLAAHGAGRLPESAAAAEFLALRLGASGPEARLIRSGLEKSDVRPLAGWLDEEAHGGALDQVTHARALTLLGRTREADDALRELDADALGGALYDPLFDSLPAVLEVRRARTS